MLRCIGGLFRADSRYERQATCLGINRAFASRRKLGGYCRTSGVSGGDPKGFSSSRTRSDRAACGSEKTVGVMAFKIVWTEQALEDLQSIVLFIAQDNHTVAESFGLRLMSKVDNLAQFPEIGRVVPEKSDETIREVVLRPYRIIYQVLFEKQMIAVIRVWHGARGEPEIPDQIFI